MISYEEALELIHQAEPLEAISLPIEAARGYLLSEQVVSQEHLPPFANSAMDGFAVRAVDIKDAIDKKPIMLPLVGQTAAGDSPAKHEAKNGASIGAWEIMTGAIMPEEYDSVVKIEDVKVEQGSVQFSAAVALGNNVRKAGEDFAVGDVIASRGTKLTPYHVMACAALGYQEVKVYRKPRLKVFNTGKELVSAKLPPKLGQIRNSNGPYLIAALQQMGYGHDDVINGGIIADEPKQFTLKVQQALEEADIIISTGAVSAGKYDFIPDALRELGAEIIFHKVAIRPSKPILYARFANGTHYFGLPGNPISAAVGLRFFVESLLRRLQGQAVEEPTTARLLMPTQKKKGLRFFLKGRLSVALGGKLQLEILKGQESFKIKPMLDANCWASLTAEQDGTEIGAPISIYPLIASCDGL